MSQDKAPLFTVQIQTPGGMKEFMIQASQFIVGRSKECGICLEEPSLSRQHIRISWIQGTITLSDLGSSNGSFLNGNKLSPFEERPFGINDRVRLGNKEIWLSYKILDNQLPQAKADTVLSPMAKGPTAKIPSFSDFPKDEPKSSFVAPKISKKEVIPQNAPRVAAEPLISDPEIESLEKDIERKKQILEREFQEWVVHQRERKEAEKLKIAEEIEALRSEKLKDIETRELEFENKYASFKQKESSLEYDYRSRFELLEREKQEFEQKKSEILFDAEAQGEIEYQKKYKEAQLLLQETEKKAHLILQEAKAEAAEYKKKSEEHLRQEILRFREKNESLRQQLDKELVEIKTLAQKEQEGYLHEAKEQARKTLDESEQKAQEIIAKALEREKQIQSECDLIAEKVKADALVKASALFEDIKKKESDLESIQLKLKKTEEERSLVLKDLEVHRKEIEKLQKNSEELREKAQALTLAEERRQKVLLECETLRKEADDYVQLKKAEGDEKLKTFEIEMQQKIQKENEVLSEVKSKIREEIEKEHREFQELLLQKKNRFSESLTQFLQVYSIENPEFDIKKAKEEDLITFKRAFHENILKEIGAKSDSVLDPTPQKSFFPRFALAAVSVLFVLLFIPPFLPQPWNERLSVMPNLNVEKSSARFIASLQENRERRVETSRVNQVFESYMVSVLLTNGFAESRKDDDYLKQWYRKAERDFFKKYRLPEEKMIQTLAKETSLIVGLHDLLQEAHPDYFGITYSKMKDLEVKTLSEMKQILGNDQAYQDFLETSRQYFTRNKFKESTAQGL